MHLVRLTEQGAAPKSPSRSPSAAEWVSNPPEPLTPHDELTGRMALFESAGTVDHATQDANAPVTSQLVHLTDKCIRFSDGGLHLLNEPRDVALDRVQFILQRSDSLRI